MATVSSTLKMFDAMSGPLRNITQGMNLMISTMRQMQNATGQNVQIDKTLVAAQQRIASAEAEISQQINRAQQSQENFNKSAKKGESAVRNIGGAVIVLNQGLELAKKLWGGFQSAMGFADQVTATNARLGLVNDGLRTQEQFQQQVLDVANKTRASYKATADLITKLGAGTQGVFKNDDQILAFAERFNKSLVISGASAWEAENAILQMSQALGSGRLQGDELRSLSETAPALMRILSDGLGVARGQLKQMGADGKLTSDKIVQAFANQSKQIDKMYATMPMTFGGAMTIMRNHAVKWISGMTGAEGPLQRITGLVQKLTAWMDSANGQKFFQELSVGISVVADGIARAGQFMIDHIDAVKAVLISLGIVMAVLGAQMMIDWIIAGWPIFAIIAAVAALIYALNRLGVSTEQIVGYVTGAFYALFAFLWNQVALIYNPFLAFAEFLVNVFIDPVYAIKKLFYDLVKDVVDYFGNMINGIAGNIDWLIGKMNKVTGTKIGLIGKLDTSFVDALKPTTNKNVVDFSKYRMEQKNLMGEFQNGYQKGVGTFKNAEKALGKLSNLMPGTSMFSPNINKVNEVGKIKDKVDISSEDLKVLRELAEMKNIQNFVTLHPTTQFNGDFHVNNGMDIDTIVQELTERMETEITAIAQGVYDT